MSNFNSKFNVKDLWKKRYGDKEEITDYAGRKMKKSAFSNDESKYQPTLDHIRPIAKGGEDIEDNIEICNRITNQEKGDTFSTWNTNNRKFQAKRVKGKHGAYKIFEIKKQ